MAGPAGVDTFPGFFSCALDIGPEVVRRDHCIAADVYVSRPYRRLMNRRTAVWGSWFPEMFNFATITAPSVAAVAMTAAQVVALVAFMDPLNSPRPGIEKMGSRILVVRAIPSNNRQAVLQRGCRNEKIRLRECMSDLAPFFNRQAPFEHHVFRDL